MWRTGLVAPRHVGSSRTRARTRFPCIGRRILNHCATREVPTHLLSVSINLPLFFFGLTTRLCNILVEAQSPNHWTAREFPKFTCFINRIIPYVTFSVWLLSLHINIFEVHPQCNVCQHFISFYGYITFHCVDIPCFLYSFTS